MRKNIPIWGILLVGVSANAADLSLNCRVIGGNSCYGAGGEMQCFEKISISKRDGEKSKLQYSLQYVFREALALPVIVTAEDSFAFELAPGVVGLEASWEMGEYLTKLLQTPHGEYVGSVTLEEDFAVTVLCQNRHR